MQRSSLLLKLSLILVGGEILTTQLISITADGTDPKIEWGLNTGFNNLVNYVEPIKISTPGKHIVYAKASNASGIVSSTTEYIVSEPSSSDNENLIIDEIDKAFTGITSTNYDSWENAGISGTKYAGYTASSSAAIQIKSTEPCGIVSTSSIGKLRSVKIVWVGNDIATKVTLYGSNTPYESTADLFDDSKMGTVLGTVTGLQSDNETIVEEDFKYFGIKASKSLNISKIILTWEKEEPVAAPVLSIADGSEVNVGDLLTISCASDATLSGMIGDDFEFNNEVSPYTYTFTEADAKAGEVLVMVQANKGGALSETVDATYIVKADPQPENPEPKQFVDEINLAFTGVTAGSTSYTNWTKTAENSGVTYIGNSAGSNSSVQLRTDIKNDMYSGIVSTSSAGYVKKVSVDWNTSTTNGRVLDIYVDDKAYTSTSELYGNSIKGTKIGTITKGTTTELEIPDGYTYIGLRSNSGALYATKITIIWEEASSTNPPTPDEPIDYEFTAKTPETLGVGKSFTVNLGSAYPSDLTITSNQYATVDGLVITGKEIGKAEFNVTWGKNDDKYNEGSATFAIEIVEVPVLPTEFELVKNIKDVVDGEYYVIAIPEGGNIYALSTSILSSRILGTAVNVKSNILTSNSSTAILKAVKANDKWLWEVENDDSQYYNQYLNLSSASNSGFTNSPEDATALTNVEFDGNYVKIGYDTDDNKTRYLMAYNGNNGPDFRTYASSNWNSNTKPSLYKRVSPKAPSMPVVKFGEEVLVSTESKVVEAGNKITITCENAESIVVKLDEEELTPDKTENGWEVTIEKSGTLTVYGKNDIGDGETFTYTFTIDTKTDVPQTKTFKQMKSFAAEDNGFDLLTEGDYYIIASNSYDVALGKNFDVKNSGFSATDKVAFSTISTGLQDFTLAETTGDDVLIFKAEKNGEDWGLKTVNFGNGYETEQVYLNVDAPDGSLNPTKEFGKVTIAKTQSSSNTTISFGDSNYQLCYAKSYNGIFRNNKKGSDIVIQLYKLTNAQKFDPQYADVEMRVGEDAVKIEPTNEIAEYPADFKIEATGTNSTQISVNKEGDDYLITAVRANIKNPVKVQASWPEQENWFAGKAEFNVVVKQSLEALAEGKVYFQHKEVKGKMGVGVLGQAVHRLSDGAVIYEVVESKLPDGTEGEVVKVDAATGMIREADVLAPGTATIKATVEETDVYAAGEDTYTITIEAADNPGLGEVDKSLEKFESFGNNGSSVNDEDHWDNLLPSYSDNESTHTSLTTGITYFMKNVMVENYQSRYFLQLKANGGYIAFVIPENCVSIDFTLGENGSSKDLDMIIGESVIKCSDQTKTFYLPKGYIQGSRMTIKNSSSGAMKIAALTFNIAAPDNTTVLSFPENERVVNTFVGVETKLPTLSCTNVDFTDVDFDVDEMGNVEDNNDNYTISHTAANDLKVTVNEPGVYTLRAFVKETKAMAIVRLNVFPTLNVLPVDGGQLVEEHSAPYNVTVAHPEVGKEAGQETLAVKLPSKVDDLINSLPKDQQDAAKAQFSTIELTKVVVKEYDAEQGKWNNGDEYTSADLENAKHVFNHDGVLEYHLTYAGTDDFTAVAAVNVIMMPQTPTVIRTDEGSTAEAIVPSKNSKLHYYTFVYTIPEKKEAPRKVLAASEEPQWNIVDGFGENGYLDIENLQYEVGDNELLHVVYKSVKDVASMPQRNATETVEANKDGFTVPEGFEPLESEADIIGLDTDGNLSGVEGIGVDFGGDEVFYNLQGIRMEMPLAPGIYIRQQGSTATKVYIR